MVPFRKEIDGTVRFSVASDIPCPCGSGVLPSSCCLTTAGFYKAPTFTMPPPPTTGQSLQSCYASDMADCSTKLSREHCISESLMHYLNQSNNLTVSGASCLEDDQKILPPSALASKTMCDRHNAALSRLDNIAVRLFQAFDENGATRSGNQVLFHFNGHDLERCYVLKNIVA